MVQCNDKAPYSSFPINKLRHKISKEIVWDGPSTNNKDLENADMFTSLIRIVAEEREQMVNN